VPRAAAERGTKRRQHDLPGERSDDGREGEHQPLGYPGEDRQTDCERGEVDNRGRVEQRQSEQLEVGPAMSATDVGS
jgi:hypothetical protein